MKNFEDEGQSLEPRNEDNFQKLKEVTSGFSFRMSRRMEFMPFP